MALHYYYYEIRRWSARDSERSTIIVKKQQKKKKKAVKFTKVLSYIIYNAYTRLRNDYFMIKNYNSS